MPKTPFLPSVNSAASTTPNANPRRDFALCVISIKSTSESYLMVCMPGTSPSRKAVISTASGRFSGASVHEFLRSRSMKMKPEIMLKK